MFYKKFLILLVINIYSEDVLDSLQVDKEKIEDYFEDYYDAIMINSLRSSEYLEVLGIFDDVLRLVDDSIEKFGIIKDQDSINVNISVKGSSSIFLELYNMFSEQMTNDVVFVIEELEKEFVAVLTEKFRISSEKEILVECKKFFNSMNHKDMEYFRKKINFDDFLEEDVKIKTDLSLVYNFLVTSFKGARNLEVLKKNVVQRKIDKDKIKKLLSAFYVKYSKSITILTNNDLKSNSINWEVGFNFKDFVIGCISMYKKDLKNLQRNFLIEKKDLEIFKSYEKLTVEHKQLCLEEQELIKLKNNLIKSNCSKNIVKYLEKYIEFTEKKKKFFDNVLFHKVLTGDVAHQLIEKYKSE